jgi:hypothetical protein
LRLPSGRALTGHSHDYKRHGTTTLFAAFEVATGKVAGNTIMWPGVSRLNDIMLGAGN